MQTEGCKQEEAGRKNGVRKSVRKKNQRSQNKGMAMKTNPQMTGDTPRHLWGEEFALVSILEHQAPEKRERVYTSNVSCNNLGSYLSIGVLKVPHWIWHAGASLSSVAAAIVTVRLAQCAAPLLWQHLLLCSIALLCALFCSVDTTSGGE